MNAGYFLIQLSSEANKGSVYEQIASSLRSDADGVQQIAFIGCINPLDPRVETKEGGEGYACGGGGRDWEGENWCDG